MTKSQGRKWVWSWVECCLYHHTLWPEVQFGILYKGSSAGLGEFLTWLAEWGQESAFSTWQLIPLSILPGLLDFPFFSHTITIWHTLQKCLFSGCYLLSVSTCCSVGQIGISALVPDKCQSLEKSCGTEWLINKSLINAWINGHRCPERVGDRISLRPWKDMAEQRRGLRWGGWGWSMKWWVKKRLPVQELCKTKQRVLGPLLLEAVVEKGLSMWWFFVMTFTQSLLQTKQVVYRSPKFS